MCDTNVYTHHGMRYPKHDDPTKGQVHGGECNTTACSRQRAVWWNNATYGLYCTHCARGINYHPKEPDLCVSVDKKPTLEQMDEMHDAWMKLFSKSQGW